MLDLLRPKPFRGDQVAAGTVFLTVLVLLLEVRFGGRWSDEARLLVAGAAALFVLGMAVPVPPDGVGPRAYLGTLYICAWILSLVTLFNLAQVLGADGLASGTITWVGGLQTTLALFFSRRRDAASGTLLAAFAGAVTAVSFVDWTVGINDVEGARRVLLAVAVVLGLVALWQRVRGPAHGVQLLNVVGLVVLAIALTFAVPIAIDFVFGGFLDSARDIDPERRLQVGTGWSLLMLVSGMSLIAAGAADAERGNVLMGILNLLAFIGLSWRGDLVGWPILLALAAGTLLVIGLRPSTPMPPEPEYDGGDGPLVELRPT